MNKHYNFPCRLIILSVWLAIAVNSANAQNRSLLDINIQTIKINTTQRAIVNARPFILKSDRGLPAPDTALIRLDTMQAPKKKYLEKGKNNFTMPALKNIKAGEYTQQVREIEKIANKEGFTLEQLNNITEPLQLYKPVKANDFTAPVKASFTARNNALLTKKTAAQLNVMAFKNRTLPGLNFKMIPAYKLNKKVVTDFKKDHPGKVNKKGKVYVIDAATPIKPAIPSDPTTPIRGGRSASFPLGSEDGGDDVLFSVNASATLSSEGVAYPINKPIDDVTLDDLRNTRSYNTVKGSLNAFGRINGTRIPIMDLSVEYRAEAYRNESHKRKIGLVLGGQTIISAATSEELNGEDVVITDLFRKTVTIPLVRLALPVGIGSLRFEWGIEGSAGVEVNGEMHRGMAGLQIKPSANLDVYSEAAAGIGIPGVYNFVEAYIRPALTLIKVDLDNYAESSLNWGTQWQLYNDISSTGDLDMLRGHLYGGLRIGYPAVKMCCCTPITNWSFPCGATWKYWDFRVTLWENAQGLRHVNKTFLNSDPDEKLFDHWE